jgi:nitroimidazol reductase NimA-like FMN-containing flavoprotein (pyridoxamine 5'-phosphate oxidase superfamily)
MEGLLPWSHAESQIEAAQNYWIATVRPGGRPHVTPVWGVWLGGALYFDGNPTTRWGRNLTANPALSIHLESAEDVVILEGVVEDLSTDADLAARIVAAWDAKYGRLHPEPAGRGMFRVFPRTARGWSKSSLEDGTRWEFED